MLIEEVKMKSVGTKVSGLVVVTTTAGNSTKTDSGWEQKIGLNDISGHIWAIAEREKNIPIVKPNELTVKKAIVEEFEDKGGVMQKMLRIKEYEVNTDIGEPKSSKPKFEGVLDPIVDKILFRYEIEPTEALWPFTRFNKSLGHDVTQWLIYHRYVEQIQAKANIIIDEPTVVVNESIVIENKTKKELYQNIVLLVRGSLGYVKEWSYGEASTKNCQMPYLWAMAEKRGKDRVILKLAGFHGIIYSELEADWSE